MVQNIDNKIRGLLENDCGGKGAFKQGNVSCHRTGILLEWF